MEAISTSRSRMVLLPSGVKGRVHIQTFGTSAVVVIVAREKEEWVRHGRLWALTTMELSMQMRRERMITLSGQIIW